MSQSHTVMRSCFACRCQQEKMQMLRLVVDAQGEIWPDLLQKAPGRGVYLCMETACLQRLSDKRLGLLRQKSNVVLPQWARVCIRLEEGIQGMVVQQLLRCKPLMCVGRDAVMHQMWKNAPLLLMMVNEMGQALQRQVMNAVDKRTELGLKTIVLEDIPVAWLHDVFQRERVSVLSLPVSKQAERLQRWCVWYRHLKGHKVSDGE